MGHAGSLIAVVAVVTMMIGCDASSGHRGDRTDDRFQAMSGGLCAALAHAEEADIELAAREFDDRAHRALHELADELSVTDRAAAARLLEAKHDVEAGFDRQGPDLTRRLRDLTAATAAGLGVLDHTVPSCHEQEP